MKIVISLGGSVILKDNSVNESFLKEFSELLSNTKHNYQIICGGGSVARVYTKTSLSNLQKDLLGIEITKVNAQLVSYFLGKKSKLSFKDPLSIGKEKGKFIISGGWKPGVTTDYDAALICKTFKPDLFINVSNVKWIYDKDPRKNKDANKIEKMSWKEFDQMTEKVKRTSGMNFIFDPKATKLLRTLGLKGIFVDSSISNLEKVLNLKKFIGTEIY